MSDRRPSLLVPVPDTVDREAMAEDLLGHRGPDGGVLAHGAYRKWQGPHWTLVSLAQIGHPGGPELEPLLEQVYRWLFSPTLLRPPTTLVVPGQEDRVRRCASQEGNAVWYATALGLADERTDALVQRLVDLQWPDGGWNCDRRPTASVSSVQETLLPLRGLVWYAASGRPLAGRARDAAAAAAEVLLARRLLWRRRDGLPIVPDWGPDPRLLGYPFRFYDVLLALLVMSEAGQVTDSRCAGALDLLMSKRLLDGGFPAEVRTARTSDRVVSRGTHADWGPFGRRRAHPFVTAEATAVLRAAGRARAPSGLTE